MLLALEQLWQVPAARADLFDRIGVCESSGQQYAGNGQVLRNRSNRHVVGIYQINENYFAKKAFSMGMNIYTAGGNRAFARHLFATQGARPWLASSGCWNHGGGTVASHRARIREMSYQPSYQPRVTYYKARSHASSGAYEPTYYSPNDSYEPTYYSPSRY
jgi:hypothetical protein